MGEGITRERGKSESSGRAVPEVDGDEEAGTTTVGDGVDGKRKEG